MPFSCFEVGDGFVDGGGGADVGNKLMVADIGLLLLEGEETGYEEEKVMVVVGVGSSVSSRDEVDEAELVTVMSDLRECLSLHERIR